MQHAVSIDFFVLCMSPSTLESPLMVTTVQYVLKVVTAESPVRDTVSEDVPAKYAPFATFDAVMICLFAVIEVPLLNAAQYTTPAKAARSSKVAVKEITLRVLAEAIAVITGADLRRVGAAKT